MLPRERQVYAVPRGLTTRNKAAQPSSTNVCERRAFGQRGDNPHRPATGPSYRRTVHSPKLVRLPGAASALDGGI